MIVVYSSIFTKLAVQLERLEVGLAFFDLPFQVVLNFLALADQFLVRDHILSDIADPRGIRRLVTVHDLEHLSNLLSLLHHLLISGEDLSDVSPQLTHQDDLVIDLSLFLIK